MSNAVNNSFLGLQTWVMQGGLPDLLLENVENMRNTDFLPTGQNARNGAQIVRLKSIDTTSSGSRKINHKRQRKPLVMHVYWRDRKGMMFLAEDVYARPLRRVVNPPKHQRVNRKAIRKNPQQNNRYVFLVIASNA